MLTAYSGEHLTVKIQTDLQAVTKSIFISVKEPLPLS